MAKIIKVGPKTITPNKVANPFKTSRTATTNPFKYSNFEGNTLQFADVFEGFEPKQINKIKMVVSSVAGSINKMHKGIIEPITTFVSRTIGEVVSAWNYAKKTNISDLPVIRDAIVNVNALNETMANKISSMGKRIADLGGDTTWIGHSISEKWSSINFKPHTNKYMGQPVEDLKEALVAALT